MKPQKLSKAILIILHLILIVLAQAQENYNILKAEELDIIGSASLDIATNQIEMLGEIANHNSKTILERGFVYSNSENSPTLLNTKIKVENAESNFSIKLSDVIINTMYYIKSYVTTEKGTTYGNLSTIDTSKQSNIDINLKAKIKTYPNPSTNYISLAGLMETKKYIIYNMAGNELARGSVSYNNKIDVRNLVNGLYLLKLDNYEIIKFIKE